MARNQRAAALKAWETRRRGQRAVARIDAQDRAKLRRAAGVSGRTAVHPLFAKGFHSGHAKGYVRDRGWVKADIQNAQEKAKVNKNLALFYKGQIKGLRAGHVEYKRGLKAAGLPRA